MLEFDLVLKKMLDALDLVRLFLYYWRWSLLVSILCLSDVLDALANHNNDRCNPDLSLSVTFRFIPRRHVRDSSVPTIKIVFTLTVVYVIVV